MHLRASQMEARCSTCHLAHTDVGTLRLRELMSDSLSSCVSERTYLLRPSDELPASCSPDLIKVMSSVWQTKLMLCGIRPDLFRLCYNREQESLRVRRPV